LLFERLFRFVEQTHVVDGDDCLICERLKDSDLFLRERPNFPSPSTDCTDCPPVSHHRHGDDGPCADALSRIPGVCRVRGLVSDVDDSAVENGASRNAITTEPYRERFEEVRRVGVRQSMRRRQHQTVFLREREAAERGIAQTRRVLDDGIENWPRVGRRVPDDAQNVARRRLLVE
jgi:hypothetical protein